LGRSRASLECICLCFACAIVKHLEFTNLESKEVVENFSKYFENAITNEDDSKISNSDSLVYSDDEEASSSQIAVEIVPESVEQSVSFLEKLNIKKFQTYEDMQQKPEENL